MNEQWRETLYLLGFLSALAFGSRMLVQWIYSEYLGKSVVTKIFWQLSICGNILLALHSFLQLQFHVFIAQTGNGVIAWRNLNLMAPQEKHLSTRNAVLLMSGTLLLGTALFASQALFVDAGLTWFRTPKTPWSSSAHQVAWFWHLFGTAGILLFNSRFWFQWWGAERKHQSTLTMGFWWMSIVGEVICLVYFMHIGDFVNAIGPLFAIVPYIRNVMLLTTARHQPSLKE